MKIFLIGMPTSGRTTVAKSLSQNDRFQYIDASSWLKSTFRDQKENEHIQQYQDEYHQFWSNRIKINPNICIDNVLDSIKAYDSKFNFIIDGVSNPRDLIHLFNINEDIIVFLNRTDNVSDYKDSDTISISVMRDLCFWMSSAGLLPRLRWLEYNFKMGSENSPFIKELGSKNSVFIVKSIDSVINHLKNKINLQDHQF